ncbi:MAG: hypothetical protein KGY38_03240 [Desulfobacterales bacterium]|nr:hypothetical protein [Desulfobacterales bacterium]
MTERKKELTEELERIEREIADLNERIPPHSVKPVFIQQLDELEARRDEITGELEMINRSDQGSEH